MAMEYDDLLAIVGEFGRYQKVIFFLVCFVGVQVAFNNMSIVFIGGIPDHWCKVQELENLNLTMDRVKELTLPKVENEDDELVYSQCEMYDVDYSNWTYKTAISAGANNASKTIKCTNGWSYDDSQYKSTIVMEWDLVCDERNKVANSQSVYMAGLMVGVLIFGSLSDFAGRKITFSLTLVLSIVFAIATAFSPNYYTFISLRFLVAFSSIGLFTTAFVIVVEIVGPSWRVFTGIMIEYFWAAGYIILAGIAYVLRDWSHLQLAISVPIILYVVLIFIIPESARWLYSKGQDEKAEIIVRKLAKINKVKLPKKLDIVVTAKKQAYICDLFKYPRLRLRSINLFFNWFVNSMVYYGLSLTSSSLGGNEYINFLISGAVEIPAYMFCQLTMNRVGRKWTLSSTMILAGTALLLTMAIPKQMNVGVVVLAMFGKFCISASFAIIYVYSAELFPTVVRNTGVGCGSFWARIGGIIAPQIGLLRYRNAYAPLIIFGITSLLAGALALLLPETMGKCLPETIEDGENFGRSTEKNIKDNKGTDKDVGTNGVINPAFCLTKL